MAKMATGRQKLMVFLVVLTFGTFYSFGVVRMRWTVIELSVKQPPPARAKGYSVDTPACQIPFLDPLHPSVVGMVKVQKDLSCSGPEPLVVVDGLRSLRINPRSSYAGTAKCYYKSISRIAENSFDTGKAKLMPKVLNVTDEFLRVDCTENGRTVFVDFFPFIQEKETVEERVKNNTVYSRTNVKLNVLLLGLDSVSKLQYLRHMKKTDKYIRENLDFIELKGYNKVGINTYPNLVAFLSGKISTTLPDTSKVPANVLPLVWKDFAEAGYRTLMSEDIPQISIFNWARKGFKEQPTDYYLRAYGVAVEKSPLIKRAKRGCFNRRLETEVILKWTKDYYEAFGGQDLFSLTFITRLSHDGFNELSYQDKPVRDFLRDMNDNGYLNNTILFFFGDHGFRFGDIRTTYIGRMEDKLPLAFIVVPPHFSKAYPQLYKNLKTNEDRLSTPFDMYATLTDILNFTAEEKEAEADDRCISLMASEIPVNRTCELAAIDSQFCSCTSRQQIKTSDARARKAAVEVVREINKFTANKRDLCAKFEFNRVLEASAHHAVTGEELDKKIRSANLQVTLDVNPSHGVFEATVSYTEDKAKKKQHFTIDANIERVNMYGNQSWCVDENFLKPYCYCKNQIPS